MNKTQSDIDDMVSRCLEEGQSLKEVIAELESEFSNLSEDDCSYVEEKYTDLLVDHWLNEAPQLIGKIFKAEHVLEIVNELASIKTFHDCYDLFGTSTYSDLITELAEISKRLKFQESSIICQLKRKCFTELIWLVDSVENELRFLQCFVKELKSSKHVHEICSTSNIKLFLEKEISFKHFLLNLTHCGFSPESLNKLQRSGKKLLPRDDNYFVADSLKKTVAAYTNPVDVSASYADGRSLLTISGKHIVISQVLTELERHPSFLLVEEVRFVNADVIHVDADFTASVWHGKNIVVLSETLIVSSDKVVNWNVSGQNAEDTKREAACTSVSGFGLTGVDGNPGESGGNIFILVDCIENSQNLKISSCGGRGSSGQDGGKGLDGEEGKYIDGLSFIRDFPPVAKLSNSKKLELLKTTLEKALLNDLKNIKTLHFGLSEITGPISDNDLKELICSLTTGNLSNIYFEVWTKKECKILFSFYFENLTICQSFLLYKGSEGEEGKSGGSGGLAGKGGFGGDIKVQVRENINNVLCISDDGKKGVKGNPGKSGKPGRNGCDRGYMDCTITLFNKWPKMFIPNSTENTRLDLKSCSDSNGSVWVPYKNCYTQIVQVNQPMQSHRSFENKFDASNLGHRQEVQVMRKKPISRTIIMKKYEVNTSLVNTHHGTLKDVRTIIEERINEVTVQMQQMTNEVHVIRPVSYFYSNSVAEETHTIPDTKCKNEEPVHDVLELIELVKSDPEDIQKWVILTKARLNLLLLQDLYEIANHGSLLSSNEHFKEIFKVLFCNKYKLALLEHMDLLEDIECHLSFTAFSKSVKVEIITSNTEVLNENDKQDSFKNIETCFFQNLPEDRHCIVNISKSYAIDEQPLKDAILSFMMGFYSLSGSSVVAKNKPQVEKKCEEFTKCKNQRLKEKLLPLNNELSKEKHKEVYCLLIESILEKNNSSKIKFECQIRNDEFLRKMYHIFVRETARQYDWKEIFLNSPLNEKQVRSAFCQDVVKNGPFSAFCREFLSQHFETNILVYTKQDDGRIVLLDNHNPRAIVAIHVLMMEDRFVQLSVDEDFVKMIDMHNHRGKLYSKILLHIESTTEKPRFDEYMNQSPYTSRDYKGVNKATAVAVKMAHILAECENVRTISNYFCLEEKSLVCSRLEKLKVEYIGYENILHFMAQHFIAEGKHVSATELNFVINLILKLALEKSCSMPLVSWSIAAYHQAHWLTQLTLLKLELYFRKILSDSYKSKLKEYISNQNKNDTLMLFLKKLEDESNVSMEYIEKVLYFLSIIPKVHMDLSHLELSEWIYYLKDQYWIHKLKAVADWSEEHLKSLSYYMGTWENSNGVEICNGFLDLFMHISNNIKSESDKEMLIHNLKSLTTKEVCISDRLLQELSSCPVGNWQEIIEKQYSSTGQERTLQQVVDMITNSGNTSENVLTRINDITDDIERLNVYIELLQHAIDSDSKFRMVFSTYLEVNKNCCNTTPVDKLKYIYEATTNFFSKDTLFLEMLGDQLLYILVNPSRTTVGDECFEEKEEFFYKQIMALTKGNFDFQNILKLVNKTVMWLPFVATAIKLKCKIQLRNTQKFAILTLLNNPKNILAQVSTGEGKSIIVLVVAIMKALSGQKVNIITSSRVLAERDAKLYKEVYELNGVTVGHNCSEDVEERTEVYSNCQVVYGELPNFQRDYLLDRFYDKNIHGDRSFDTVIVDEVDSMLLDKGNNVLYLSHDIPGLDKLEPVFSYIWTRLNKSTTVDQFESLFNIESVKECILFEIFDRITKENIRDLDTSLTGKHVDNTWEYLVKTRVINNSGKILNQHIENAMFDDLPEDCYPKDHLYYLLKKVIERDKLFHIPNFLKSFVEDHLEAWIRSGMTAMVMERGRDYVVDVDRSGTSSERCPQVTIIDRDTGTDLYNSQWEEGLHQFLQLKHGCKLSLLSLKSVFISNVSYLQLYKTLYGLTGTLGSKRERQLLEDIYKVDFVTIPTAKTKAFSEELPIMCSNTSDWLDQIREKVCKVTEKRSALIICETVNEVLALKQIFPQNKVHTYTRDYEKSSPEKNLSPGKIIISTNLAGRGTDIKLSKKLIDAGGLYVCLSFLPNNSRIEEQAYGRAARNGEPGSAQMIFKSPNQPCGISMSKIIDIKKQRDLNEIVRLADVKNYHQTRTQPQEEWFLKFKQTYDDIKSTTEQDVKSLLLQTCLDQWALWLDKHFNVLISHSSAQDIELSFKEFTLNCKKLGVGDFEIWSKAVKDPFQLVKLGLVFLKKNENVKASLIFSQVVNEEPYFSEIAYYFRICAKASNSDHKITDLLDDFEIVAKLLENRIESSLLSVHVLDFLKEHDTKGIVQIDSFKQQQINVSGMYSIFLQSVMDIVGYDVTPQSFLWYPVIDEQTAYSLWSALVEEGVISKPELKTSVADKELQFVTEYGMSLQIIKSFLKPFEGTEIDGIQLLKTFKKECPLPSRELFWKQLLFKNILSREEKYVFVDVQQLNLLDPSLVKDIGPLSIDYNVISENRVWLYQPKEIGQFIENSAQLVIKQNELKRVMENEKKYQFLKRRGLFLVNKQATISNPHENVSFDLFDSISQTDFQIVGIASDVALEIVKDLNKNGAINEISNGSSSDYSLLIDADDIELTKYKAYTEDVKALIKICFAFRIALRKFSVLLCQSEEVDNLCLPLPINLHKKIIYELRKKQIVKKSVVGSEINIDKTIVNMYPNSMDKAGYERLFDELLRITTRKKLVNELIKIELLVQTSTSTQLFYKGTYSINDTLLSELETNFQSSNCQHVKHIETAIRVLSNHLKLTKNLSFIKNVLKNSKGLHHSVGTPSFSLIPLLGVLQNLHMPTSEIALFSLNGFDQLLVIQEKKYTWRMKCNTFFVTMIAISEISAGSFLNLLAIPLGPALIEEGLRDLCFAVECMFTGYCTWKDYAIVKLSSLIVSLTSSVTFIKNTFKATFGTKVNISSQVTKQNCTKLFQTTKDVLKDMLTKSATINKSHLKTVVEHVSIRAVQGIALGITSSMVHHVIQHQLEYLGERIVEVIYSDISNTITSHHVIEVVKELHIKFGEHKSKYIIVNCVSKIIENYKDIHEKNWEKISLSVKTLIKQHIDIFSQQSVNTILNHDAEMYMHLYMLISKIVEVVKECRTHYNQLSVIVSAVLNDIEDAIQDELRQQLYSVTVVGDECLEDFLLRTVEDLSLKIKSMLSDEINQHVIHPVLHFTADHLLALFLRNVVCNLFDNKASHKLKELKIEYLQAEEKTKETNDDNNIVNLEYDECLLKMLEKKRNASIFVELLKNNSLVDMNFIELCCTVIPAALRKEGVEVPGLEIVVEKNGIQKRFFATGVEHDVMTIVVAPNADVTTNIKKNKILIKKLFHAIFTKLSHSYPEQCQTAEALLMFVINAIESNQEIQQLINGVEDDKITVRHSNKINALVEESFPYQNSHSEGNWVFSPKVDVDLREYKKFCALTQVYDHTLQGFQTALGKINNHIYKVQNHLKPPFKLDLNDFFETRHQIVPQTDKNSRSAFHCYAAKYEMVMPFRVNNTDQLVDFSITLSLKNKVCKTQRPPHCPLGPHILYEIFPVKNTRHLDKGVKGHVLLGLECEQYSYSAKDCHASGDLILPTDIKTDLYYYMEKIKILKGKGMQAPSPSKKKEKKKKSSVLTSFRLKSEDQFRRINK